MSAVDQLLKDLVVANRILAHEGVVDGYGHVSARHPGRDDRFFLACSKSPEQVTLDDLMEYDLDCRPIEPGDRPMYIERPIHSAVYRARPDIRAVIHNHAPEVIPFSTSQVRLRPICHAAAGIGADVPVWDIRHRFGDTNMLVTTLEQGHDLAACLGGNRTALMRGHGAVVTGPTLQAAVHAAVYLKLNARLQKEAMAFGDNTFLSDGEIALLQEQWSRPGALQRVWENWAARCGAAELFREAWPSPWTPQNG